MRNKKKKGYNTLTNASHLNKHIFGMNAANDARILGPNAACAEKWKNGPTKWGEGELRRQIR